MSGHAFLAPSSASRWRLCPGSALIESLYPDLSDPEPRRLGVACHWLMECALKAPFVIPPEGTIAPNGVAITVEMIDAVQLMRGDIMAKLGANWASMIQIENPVAIPRIDPQCWGTPDVRAWVQLPNGRRVLFIWDLKYGWSRVEVFENDQLVCYAAGCLSEANTGTPPAFPESQVDVVLVVVQPRAYHPQGPVREWKTTAVGLRDYVHQLNMAATEATSATPVCRPQPAACENCTGRAHCDTLQQAAYRGMDLAAQAIPRELSDSALGLELAMLSDAHELMKARLSGLEEVVKHRLQQGRRVAHWYYGPGQGSTKWTKPASEVILMGQMMGKDLAKPPEAITPLQAKAKGLDDGLVMQYAQTIPGATKLMRSTGTDARRVFSKE